MRGRPLSLTEAGVVPGEPPSAPGTLRGSSHRASKPPQLVARACDSHVTDGGAGSGGWSDLAKVTESSRRGGAASRPPRPRAAPASRRPEPAPGPTRPSDPGRPVPARPGSPEVLTETPAHTDPGLDPTPGPPPPPGPTLPSPATFRPRAQPWPDSCALAYDRLQAPAPRAPNKTRKWITAWEGRGGEPQNPERISLRGKRRAQNASGSRSQDSAESGVRASCIFSREN